MRYADAGWKSKQIFRRNNGLYRQYVNGPEFAVSVSYRVFGKISIPTVRRFFPSARKRR